MADLHVIRAVFTLGNAEKSQHSQETLQVFRGDLQEAHRSYATANDGLRSWVAEMRPRQPSIASEAEALWRGSMVPARTGVESLDPSDDGRRAAEANFIAKVRWRLDQLK